LHNEKAGLSAAIDKVDRSFNEVSEAVGSAMESIGNLNNKRDAMYQGAFIGLIIGSAIGHIFL
jgi:hypothetical protein